MRTTLLKLLRQHAAERPRAQVDARRKILDDVRTLRDTVFMVTSNGEYDWTLYLCDGPIFTRRRHQGYRSHGMGEIARLAGVPEVDLTTISGMHLLLTIALPMAAVSEPDEPLWGEMSFVEPDVWASLCQALGATVYRWPRPLPTMEELWPKLTPTLRARLVTEGIEPQPA